MHFSSFALFSVVITCAVTGSFGTHYPEIYYVNELCNVSLSIVGDARIRIAKPKQLPAGSVCYLNFTSYNNIELTGTFLDYTMNRAYTNEYGVCNDVFIQLYDGRGISLLSTYDKYCSKNKPSSYYYIRATGQLLYSVDSHTSVSTPYVNLLVSEFSPKGVVPCAFGYFDCGNQYCVPDFVTCNGYNDCNNNRDETKDCYGDNNAGEIAGLISGCGAVIIIIVLIVLIVRRRRIIGNYERY